MRQMAQATSRIVLAALLLQTATLTAIASSINVFSHVHSNKMPRTTRILHPNDMGLYKMQSSGPLVLSNGTTRVVAAVTYVKILTAGDGDLDMRCDA